jgi:hypothetical protein
MIDGPEFYTYFCPKRCRWMTASKIGYLFCCKCKAALSQGKKQECFIIDNFKNYMTGDDLNKKVEKQ